MPREIKCRGFVPDREEWIVGSLIGNNVIVGEIVDFSDDYFATEFWQKVAHDSVGEYTGLKDSAGNEIFEGDILQDEKGLGEVCWVDVHCAFMCYVQSPAAYWRMECDGQMKRTIIVGNIYEHPELLES